MLYIVKYSHLKKLVTYHKFTVNKTIKEFWKGTLCY